MYPNSHPFFHSLSNENTTTFFSSYKQFTKHSQTSIVEKKNYAYAHVRDTSPSSYLISPFFQNFLIAKVIGKYSHWRTTSLLLKDKKKIFWVNEKAGLLSSLVEFIVMPWRYILSEGLKPLLPARVGRRIESHSGVNIYERNIHLVENRLTEVRVRLYQISYTTFLYVCMNFGASENLLYSDNIHTRVLYKDRWCDNTHLIPGVLH